MAERQRTDLPYRSESDNPDDWLRLCRDRHAELAGRSAHHDASTARRRRHNYGPDPADAQRLNRKTAVLASKLGKVRTVRPSCKPKLSWIFRPLRSASTSKSA